METAPWSTEFDRFLAFVLASGLVPYNDLQTLGREFASRLSNPFDIVNSLDAFCAFLQRRSVLTAWQCEKLRKGQYKGFFFDEHYKLLQHDGAEATCSRYLAVDVRSGQQVRLRIKPQQEGGKHDYTVTDA